MIHYSVTTLISIIVMALYLEALSGDDICAVWIFQRKSSAPETEEKVRRLRRKNTELAVLAKRLEERARKLQEANLRVVRCPTF